MTADEHLDLSKIATLSRILFLVTNLERFNGNKSFRTVKSLPSDRSLGDTKESVALRCSVYSFRRRSVLDDRLAADSSFFFIGTTSQSLV